MALIYNTSTTSKRSLWPPETSHLWVMRAHKSRLMLSDGNWYDDWASALGANTLGYDAVPLAPWNPAASLPWKMEGCFADQFCQAMDTEAVRFFKSGSDAVSCAVRLARAFTGRELVIMFKECYHGTASEFKPIAWHKAGYPDQPAIALPFGRNLIKANYSDVAAIVLEPVPKSILLPPDGWLQHLKEICDANGILLVSDEVILGYRHSLRGYLRSAGIIPDLACYGKAMAQGAAVSAVTGRQEIMSLLEKEVHFSGTNNGEPLPLAIASWTLAQYTQQTVCEELAFSGKQLKGMLTQEGFETRGLDSRFEIVFDSPEQRVEATRCLWKERVMFPGFCSMAVSHTAEQMERLVSGLRAWRKSL